jgi:peptide methionine sulfoxide reductase MsrB
MNKVQCLIIDLTKFNSHFRHVFSKTPIQGTKSLSPRQTLNGVSLYMYPEGNEYLPQ